MEFSYFDLVISIIILLLGLKGILNGFFKEVFGLIGIIGGIFIASRFGSTVGGYLNDFIFNFDNQGAISFTGFLVTLSIFWLLMISTGYAFKKLGALSGLGIYDRVLGFMFGASKFFLIAAVIIHAIYNINTLRAPMDSLMQNSMLFSALERSGAFIMKIDPVEISDDINATIDITNDLVEEEIQEVVDEESEKIVDEVTNNIQTEFDKNQTELGNQ